MNEVKPPSCEVLINDSISSACSLLKLVDLEKACLSKSFKEKTTFSLQTEHSYAVWGSISQSSSAWKSSLSKTSFASLIVIVDSSNKRSYPAPHQQRDHAELEASRLSGSQAKHQEAVWGKSTERF